MKIDPGQQFQAESLSRKKPGKNNAEADPANIKDRPSAVVNLSSTAKTLSSKADGLAPYEEARPDVVAQAETELKDWNGLSDGQIDNIMDRMFNELG
jgi:hypothetical protein